MADTPNGETANPGDSKTEGQTTAPTQGNAVDQSQVEQARKEAEQARMRANQLENELRQAKEAEEARKAKELEEKEEFKSLYEQTKSQLEEIKTAQEKAQRETEINAAKSEVFNGFSQEVIEIAEEAGMSLSDTSDEAKAQLKEKLEKIQTKVAKDNGNTPNNPSTTSSVGSQEQIINEMRYGTPQQKQQAKATAINNLVAIQEMKRQAGFQSN